MEHDQKNVVGLILESDPIDHKYCVAAATYELSLGLAKQIYRLKFYLNTDEHFRISVFSLYECSYTLTSPASFENISHLHLVRSDTKHWQVEVSGDQPNL